MSEEKRKIRIINIIKYFFKYYIALNLGISLLASYILLWGIPAWIIIAFVSLVICLIYYLNRNKQSFELLLVNTGVFIILLLFFTFLMSISQGNISGRTMMSFIIPAFPFLPLFLLMSLFTDYSDIYLTIFILLFLQLLLSFIFQKQRYKNKTVFIISALLLSLIVINIKYYINRPELKYSGHGFDYMNGYSSTDFSDYLVYSDSSKLVILDEDSSFKIDEEANMPIMDGAEACYPLYASIAKNIYVDIDQIEKDYIDKPNDSNGKYESINGKIVQFSNTVYGISRLIEGHIDLFFGAEPSLSQKQDAKDNGVELVITPIGKEAFVFFVEEDNPIDNLSVEELRSIYHGDIKNWKQVGGDNQDIIAFQRPEGSGSQTIMNHFMNGMGLQEPQTYEIFNSMGGVIKEVAQYANEQGAIGYSFRYFVEELNQEKNVKILSVDGVYPSLENIQNGSYPICVDLCIISRKDNDNPNVEEVINYVLSKQGQKIIQEVGYAPLNEQ